MTNETASQSPAFPRNYDHQGHNGLTKREYFAACAMQGILASWGQHDVTAFEDIAADAVLAAEKLMEALNID
jgi:predicted DNA-binding WGR domain protein